MKQVPQDLIDYLLTMISPPPHIPDVQIPIVLDVTGYDFSQYADSSLHGLIARGSPTMEQSAEINRALKPGAHVMLMTAEEDLTGHVGTCNLEDSGLEIRDSLVVLEEGMPFFYGAKAPQRERNAGCNDLAAEPQWGLKAEYLPSEDGEAEASDNWATEMLEAGLTPDEVEFLTDGGTIGQSKVPSSLRKMFVEKKGAGRGNIHPTCKPVDVLEWLLKDLPADAKTVLDPFMGCYDEATEVLTKEGWKYFTEVLPNDLYLTRSVGGDLEYQPATKHHAYEHKGEMIRVLSRSTDLLVTPNHNMLVVSHADFNAKRGPKLVPAEGLTSSLYRIPCGGQYAPQGAPLSRGMMYLIGLYVSEGYLSKENNTDVLICQNRGAKWDQMVSWVEEFRVTPRSDRKFTVRVTPQQYQFLLENCGQSKYLKFLSPTILENEHLDALFDAMMLGDGSTSKDGQQQYYTVSPKLAGAFQELCLKLNLDSTLLVRHPREGSVIRGRAVKGTTPCYNICVRRSAHKKLEPKRHLSKEAYDGMVYCVTVPNHTLYVRRNGRTSWCGNSGTMGIAAVKTGHDYIGMEMDAGYIKIADARIRHWASAENGWKAREIVSEAQREDTGPQEMSLDDLFNL